MPFIVNFFTKKTFLFFSWIFSQCKRFLKALAWMSDSCKMLSLWIFSQKKTFLFFLWIFSQSLWNFSQSLWNFSQVKVDNHYQWLWIFSQTLWIFSQLLIMIISCNLCEFFHNLCENFNLCNWFSLSVIVNFFTIFVKILIYVTDRHSHLH